MAAGWDCVSGLEAHWHVLPCLVIVGCATSHHPAQAASADSMDASGTTSPQTDASDGFDASDGSPVDHNTETRTPCFLDHEKCALEMMRTKQRACRITSSCVETFCGLALEASNNCAECVSSCLSEDPSDPCRAAWLSVLQCASN